MAERTRVFDLSGPQHRKIETRSYCRFKHEKINRHEIEDIRTLRSRCIPPHQPSPASHILVCRPCNTDRKKSGFENVYFVPCKKQAVIWRRSEPSQTRGLKNRLVLGSKDDPSPNKKCLAHIDRKKKNNNAHIALCPLLTQSYCHSEFRRLTRTDIPKLMTWCACDSWGNPYSVLNVCSLVCSRFDFLLIVNTFFVSTPHTLYPKDITISNRQHCENRWPLHVEKNFKCP